MADRPPGPPDRRPLLERPDLKPEDRRRIGRAVVPLLAWGLSASAVLVALTIWHLIRRGRRLRSNLAAPKSIYLPETGPRPNIPDTND